MHKMKQHLPPTKGISRWAVLIMAALGAVVVMALFEIAKQLIAPEITVRQSDIVTTVFVTILSILTAAFLFGQRDKIVRQQQLFQIVADFTYDWEYWIAPDGAVLYVSPSCERITGYSQKEIMETPQILTEMIIDKSNTHQLPPSQLLEPFESEFRIVRKDGEMRWIGHACQPVLGKNQQYLGHRASNRDITKQKNAQLDLAQSETLYREIARNLPDSMVCVVDTAVRFRVVEGALLQATGFLVSDLEGKVPRDALPTNVSALLEPRFRRALTGAVSEYEVEQYGHVFWSKYVPLRNADKEITGALALIVDITERKQGEELLERARVLDQVQDAIVAVDNHQIIRYANEAVFRQYELDPATPIVGTKLGTHYQYEWISDTQEQEAYDSLETTGIWKGINTHITSKGNRLWVESIVSSVMSRSGKRLGLVAVMRDTTQRKRIEDECHKTAQDLEAVNKELETFSYSVTHDLRGPLNTIGMFAEILLEDYSDRLDDQGTHYLQRVRGGVEKMGRIIEDTMTLSRIGRQEIKPQDFDISARVRAYLQELSETSPQRIVEISIEDDIHCYADPRLISLALENLLRNAWKFTSKKEHARIAFGAIGKGKKVTYFVRDNGAGFPMEYAEELFTPFKRLHAESEFSGTGVGLAIVQRVISRHGGRIWAESAEGKGASFYFTLGQ